jgi:hypothetical protein
MCKRRMTFRLSETGYVVAVEHDHTAYLASADRVSWVCMGYSFHVIRETSLKTVHGRRNRMLKELRRRG